MQNHLPPSLNSSSPSPWLAPQRYSRNLFGLGKVTDSQTANPLLAGSVLVDPGTNYRELVRSLAAINVPLARIDTVLLTHLHWDHWGALPELVRSIRAAGGNVQVLGPAGAKAVAAAADPGAMGLIYYPRARERTVWLDDEFPIGQEIEFGDITITGFATPGHTVSQMSYLVRDYSDTGFSVAAIGDGAGGLIDPRTGSCFPQYRDSLEVMLEMGADGYHEGHGDPQHLLTPARLRERVRSWTARTEGDLFPGDFPGTLFPHYK